MSWATIGTLAAIDQNQNSVSHFAIPADGSLPQNPGNCMLEPIFYQEDVEVLLAQANDITGIRLINTYLNTPAGGDNNPIALTFLVACRGDNGQYVNLNGHDNKLAITCPPIYMKSAKYDCPKPGFPLPVEMIEEIDSNDYDLSDEECSENS